MREAEKIILSKSTEKGYLPIEGDPEFVQEALKLVFGDTCKKLGTGEIFGAQELEEADLCELRANSFHNIYSAPSIYRIPLGQIMRVFSAVPA